MPITYDRLGRTTVYASRLGCALNASLSTGGGTDDTALLQAALTTLGAAGGGTLVVDGVALASTLAVPSGVTLTGLGRTTGLFQVAGTSGPLVRNATPVAGPTVPTDHNVGLRDLYLNGNRAGGHGYSGAWGVPLQLDANGKYLAAVQFFGVSGLRIENVEVYEPACFHFWLSNCDHFAVRDVKADVVSPAANYNQDGVHLNGYCTFGVIDGVRGTTNDDFVALNADDSYYSQPSPDYGMGQPGSAPGPITDVAVRGVYPEGSVSCVRLTSTVSRIDRVTVDAVGGSAQSQLLLVDSFPSFNVGPGNVGSIRFGPSDLRLAHTNGFLPGNMVDVRGSVERLALRGVARQDATGASQPTVWIEPTAQVGQLSIDGLDVRDSDPANDPPAHLQFDGYVGQLLLTATNWVQAYPGAGTLLGGRGAVGSLVASATAAPAARVLPASGLTIAAKGGDTFAGAAAVTSFVDTFNRSNRPLGGDNGWTLVAGNAPTIANGSLLLPDPGSGAAPVVVNAGVSAANVTVAAVVATSPSGSGVGLIFRYTSASSYYLMDFESAAGGIVKVFLYSCANGAFPVIGTAYVGAAGSWPAGLSTLVKVVSVGSTHTAYFGGAAVATFTDATVTAAGTTGLRSGGSGTGANRTIDAFVATAP